MAKIIKFGMKNIPSYSVFLASARALAGLLAGAPEAADTAISSSASGALAYEPTGKLPPCSSLVPPSQAASRRRATGWRSP